MQKHYFWSAPADGPNGTNYLSRASAARACFESEGVVVFRATRIAKLDPMRWTLAMTFFFKVRVRPVCHVQVSNFSGDTLSSKVAEGCLLVL